MHDATSHRRARNAAAPGLQSTKILLIASAAQQLTPDVPSGQLPEHIVMWRWRSWRAPDETKSRMDSCQVKLWPRTRLSCKRRREQKQPRSASRLGTRRPTLAKRWPRRSRRPVRCPFPASFREDIVTRFAGSWPRSLHPKQLNSVSDQSPNFRVDLQGNTREGRQVKSLRATRMPAYNS